MFEKPNVEAQGKAVIEFSRGDWLLMLPDGHVSNEPSEEAARAKAYAWFRCHAREDAINVGQIEVRR